MLTFFLWPRSLSSLLVYYASATLASLCFFKHTPAPSSGPLYLGTRVFLLSAWSLPHFLLICTATFSSLESPPKLPSLSSSWLYIVSLLLSSLSSNTLYLSVISSVSHPTTSAPPKQGLFSVLFAVVSPALCLVYIMWSTDFCQMSK